jgi:hypothetical protein
MVCPALRSSESKVAQPALPAAAMMRASRKEIRSAW